MPGATVDADRERLRQLLGNRAGVVRRASELNTVAAALVDGVVTAHGIGVCLAQPFETEGVTDLLVGGRGKDEVAGGTKAFARKRGKCDRLRRDLALHVEG